MGKRLFRYFQQDLPQSLPVLLSKQVNVVFKNGTVRQGILINSTTTEVFLKDQLRKIYKIKLNEIEEIVFDKESTF